MQQATILDLSVSEAGTYVLEVLDQTNGCLDTAEVVVMPDMDAPIAHAGPDQQLSCVLQQLTLNGSNSSTGPEMEYQWEDAGGMVLGNSLLLNVSAYGSYYLIVENTDNNCIDTAEVVVAIDTLSPILDPGADTLLNCYVPEISIGDPAADPTWVFEWEDASGNGLGADQLVDDRPGRNLFSAGYGS